jgi:hypothetical protein
MTHYEGLLLDFGGVVTTDFFAALGAHCERLGLSHDSFRNLVTADPTVASCTTRWNAGT